MLSPVWQDTNVLVTLNNGNIASTWIVVNQSAVYVQTSVVNSWTGFQVGPITTLSGPKTQWAAGNGNPQLAALDNGKSNEIVLSILLI